MFKSQNKTSLAQQLKSKFSFASPRDASRGQQGAGDRRMPRIPGAADQNLMQQSLKDKMTPSNNEFISSYGPLFLEHSIAAEYNHLKKTRIPGVYCIPSFHDPLVWFGVVFIRQGIYQNGVFRFTLTIPNNYPDGDCPTLAFTPPVFHPFINPTTGVLSLEKAFIGWKPNVNHIWQILVYVRRIFYKFDSNDPTNIQAAQLFESDLPAYGKKAEAVIAEINNTLYDDLGNDDPHAFRFREWNSELHEPLKQKILERKPDEVSPERCFEKPKLSGLSYIEPGTSWIFSKEA